MSSKIWLTITLLLIHHLAAEGGNGLYIRSLVYDLQEFFAAENLIIVTSAEEEECWHCHVPKVPMTVLPFDNATSVKASLHIVLHAGSQLPFVALVGITDKLFINDLQNELSLFGPDYVALMPIQEVGYLKLRLDSNLYLYSLNDGVDRFDIREAYSIKSGPIIEQHMGTWNFTAGLSVPVRDIWQRRADLRGVELVDAMLEWEVFNRLTFDAEGRIESARGPFADIMSYLSAKLNFTTRMVKPPDGQWGGREANGSWNGMVGMLAAGEADLTSAGMIYMQARDTVTSTSVALARGSFTLVARRSRERATHFWVYWEIFPVSAWALFFTTIFLLASGFVTIDRSGPNIFDTQCYAERFTMENSLAFCSLLFMQKTWPVSMLSASSKLLFVVASWSAYIAFTYYTCDLTSRMSTVPTPVAIRSFDDVWAGNYKVLVIPATTNNEILKQAKPGSGMHRVYHERMKGNPKMFVESDEEAFSRLNDEPNTLYFSSSLALTGLNDYILLDLVAKIPSDVGWVFRKNSEFLRLFNRHLYLTIENGLMEIASKKWNYVPAEEFDIPEAPSLGYENTSFPFVALAIFVIVAVLTAFVERIKIKLQDQ